MKPSLLLLGYSGWRNFGDDLLLKQAYDAFVDVAEIVIHTTNLGSGSDYLYAWFPDAEVEKRTAVGLGYLRQFDFVLYYGGGVFFDYKPHSTWRYLRKLLSHTKNYSISRMFGTKFGGIGLGLGPFVDRYSELAAAFRLRQFDFVNVRDVFSYAFCAQNGVKSVNLTNDLSLLSAVKYSRMGERLSVDNAILICPRHYPHGSSKNTYVTELVKSVSGWQDQGYRLSVFGLQSNHDEPVVGQFSARGVDAHLWNPDIDDLESVFELFADANLVVSARMHGIYVSGMVGTPCIGIGVHPKLVYAAELFELVTCLGEDFQSESLNEVAAELLSVERNSTRNHLEYVASDCRHVYDTTRAWMSKMI